MFKETLDRLHKEIAEHRNTGQELLAERNFVAAINDTVGALIVVCDEEGRIVRFNRACEEVTNYRFEEVEAALLWERVIPAEEVDRAKQAFVQTKTDRRTLLYEMDWLTRAGTRRTISWANTTLAGSDGSVEHVIGCGVDITVRREAESQLRQAQKLETIGQLTGGVAHDFNNLLAIILGNLELLQDHPADDPRGEKLIDPAMRAGERGSELTQRLLSFARRQPLSPKAVDLNALAAGLVTLLQRTIGEGIEIPPEPAPGLWPCRVDPGQLEDALLNLALNARDAMPQGGRLVIATSNVGALPGINGEFDDVADGEFVLLAVSDSGSGIDPDARQRIFEPFFTTKEVGKGSGLGLSMVYGFVKQTGG